jgi:hypothetical protein
MNNSNSNTLMYKNIGSSHTVHNGESSEVQWHTEYDGKNASVLTETTENGKTKYNELTFTNQELADIGGIINIPKHLESLDVRLLQDYPHANTNENKKENDDKLFRHDVSQMPKKSPLRIKGGHKGKSRGKGKGRRHSLRKSKKKHKRTKQKCKKKCKSTYKKSK